MGVGPSCNQAQSFILTAPGQSLGVGAHLSGVGTKFRLQQLQKEDAPRCQHISFWSPLNPGEDRPVQRSSQGFPAQDHAAAPWTAKSLLGGHSNHIGVWHRTGNSTARNQSAVMGAVHPQVCPHLVADFPECGIVDGAGIGRGPSDDQFGPVLSGDLTHLIYVNAFGLPIDAIMEGVEFPAAEVKFGPVAQMSAVIQGHPQKGVAWFQQSIQHRHVGDGGVSGLDIGVLRAKHPLDSFQRKQFRLICQLTSAHKPLSGVAFGIFVGENRSLQAGCQGGYHIF